ncbi:MAG: glycosyltransferase [Candidatus Hydrogenedens sp.]|nr:glycosyltransferase [Candidatus Hydrogenedens sp.]
MDAPRVSVLLPARNAAVTLAESIASIQRQTQSDWELLLWDDGSEDATPAIIDAYTSADRRIRLAGSGRVGITEALRRLAESTKAALIGRMDGDDVSQPERFERQVALLRANPAVGLCGTRVRIFGATARSGSRRYETWMNALLTPEDHRRERFIECPIAHPAFLMRREAYDAAGGYQESDAPEDYDLLLRIVAAGWACAKTPEVLLDWRDSPRRLSRTDPRYAEGAFRALKRRHLFKGVLPAGADWYQWGAGEVGKRWLREWGSRAPAAVVDIRPGKLGQTIHGIPVIPPEALPPPMTCGFILIAVGTPGARNIIREWLVPRGYREDEQFLFIA